MNICGVLVHAMPERIEEIRRSVGELPGVEIHRIGGDGRMVVTVEDTDSQPAGDTVLALHRTPGVLSAALVYHHFEADETTIAQRETLDGTDPS